MNIIDLRSDTLTKPTAAMRKAMAEAEVGDDGRVDMHGRGGDPTINRLEDFAAELMGKEAALFCASGTMGNVLATITHCQRGDKVAIEPDLHLVKTEKAPFMERFFGLVKQPYECVKRGIADSVSFNKACQEAGVRLACIENSHNFGGGVCSSVEHLQNLYNIAHKHGVSVHLDGARIFNAANSLQESAKKIAECADTVMVCLSKGLGAPFGSLLCGKEAFIARARENRKLLGGGLRQGGVMAAAGLLALKNGVDQLAEDNQNARRLGDLLGGFNSCVLVPVETNIVMLEISATGKKSAWFEERLATMGLLLKGMGDNYIRLTTYREISQQNIEQTGLIFSQFMKMNNFS